jgi:hypothetical protein
VWPGIDGLTLTSLGRCHQNCGTHDTHQHLALSKKSLTQRQSGMLSVQYHLHKTYM